MQYTLMGAPSVLNKVNDVLMSETQTMFFNLVLEELALKHRTELVGEVPAEDEGYDPEQDSNSRIETFVESVLGECPEDRPEEEHQSMVDSLVNDVTDLLDEVVDTLLTNDSNGDQLNILSEQDFGRYRDLTWTLSENGVLVIALK